MTLNANKPTDQVSVSELASYIRECRVAINAVAGSGNVGITDLVIGLGTTSLTIGSDLGTYGFETVLVTGEAAITLISILGGTNGQVKKFIFLDNNVSIKDGIPSDGKIYLNQLPALSTFDAHQNDILEIVNVGGNGASIYGYWQEVGRQIAIK